MINEEYLTGNSTPCRKTEINNFELSPTTEVNSTLYMGTEIVYIEHETIHNELDIPSLEYKSILCLAVRTNYSCMRGQYLRSILYPKPHAFKLFTESISFLIIMFFINALGFLAILSKVSKYIHNSEMVNVFLDLLTTAIPPTLPTAMTVGIGFALRRLQGVDINCTVKQKILVGGRVDTIMIQNSVLVTKNTTTVLGFLYNSPQE